MNQAELHLFYEELVRKLRDQGVVCAITSGLACVHYGVAETTKDCDLLCHLMSQAREAMAAFIQPELLRWLPNVRPYFKLLAV